MPGAPLAVAGVGIAVVLVVLYGASPCCARGQSSVDVRLGDQTVPGRQRRAAGQGDRRATAPILYGDVSDSGSGDQRDIFLQHLGDDPDEGWYAFRAQPPGTERDCTWQLAARRGAVPGHAATRTSPPGRRRGPRAPTPSRSEDGKLDIDLNLEQPAAPPRRPRPPRGTPSPATSPTTDRGAQVEEVPDGGASGPCWCRCGELVDDPRPARGDLVGAELLLGPGDRGPSGEADAPGDEADGGHGDLAQAVVGQADHGGLEHRGVLLERLLDLDGVDE